MPGIFGAFTFGKNLDLNSLAGDMIAAMNHDGRMRIDRLLERDKGLCAGRVSLGALNPVDQPLHDPAGLCRIIFHGELFGNHSSSSDPEFVLEQYMEKGDRCALDLNGIFHFLIYDQRTGQIKLFNDKFGLQPLYYSALPDGMVFGGEVKAVLADKRISRKPDYRGFADFLHFGQILGNKTLFSEIKMLPPASCAVYNLKDRTMSISKYWQLDSLFVEKGAYDPHLSTGDVVSLLVDSIRAQGSKKDMLGLSLSGGLDSRGILAGLGGGSKGIHTYTLGLPGCADQKLAEQMSRVADTNHEFIEMDQGLLHAFEVMASEMIRLSDGMYHPHESTEMLALEYFKKGRFKILLRGHGGEIAKAALAYPVMVTPRILSSSGGNDILENILRIANLVKRDVNIESLFASQLQDIIREGPAESLRESCGKISDTLAPGDVCIYYYINEHIRRQVVHSLDIFRTQIDIRMPYVDEKYMQSLLRLPIRKRFEGEIHIELVRKCMPELLKIPNSNTGAPLDAGALRLFLTDKFNSLMKRLSIKGFRHYTEFEDWHRNQFRSGIEKIFFDQRTLDRGLYNPSGLREIFDLHTSGKKNYAHLLGTIVGLEMWYRNFVDTE